MRCPQVNGSALGWKVLFAMSGVLATKYRKTTQRIKMENLANPSPDFAQIKAITDKGEFISRGLITKAKAFAQHVANVKTVDIISRFD